MEEAMSEFSRRDLLATAMVAGAYGSGTPVLAWVNFAGRQWFLSLGSGLVASLSRPGANPHT